GRREAMNDHTPPPEPRPAGRRERSPSRTLEPCGADLYFHNTRSVFARSTTPEQQHQLLHMLRGHVGYADIRPNKFPRNFEMILTVTSPDETARKILAGQRWLVP